MHEAADRSETTDPSLSASPLAFGEPVVTAPALEIHLPPLRPALLGAAWLLIETLVIPTALFTLFYRTSGLVVGLLTSLGWCYGVLAVRMARRKRLPGTLLLNAGMVTGRTMVALLASSAFLYLLQPVIGGIAMALVFIGSAVFGRPVTERLTRDFLHVPEHIVSRVHVRRMFRDVALLWGISRVASAGLSLGLLRGSTGAGLLARGVIAPAITIVSVAVCAAWGARCLRRDGVHLRRRGYVPVPA